MKSNKQKENCGICNSKYHITINHTDEKMFTEIYVEDEVVSDFAEKINNIINQYIITAKVQQDILISEGYGKKEQNIGKSVIIMLQDIKKILNKIQEKGREMK